MKVVISYRIYWLFIIAILLLSCKESIEGRYKKYEKSELAKGVRKDSLFMGLYFQMTKEDFRTYCFDMNLEGKFKQGGNKSSIWVESKLESTTYPAAINFYPNFKDDKISELNASIYYKNAVYKDGIFELDSLMLDVLGLMKKWYGKEVFKIKSPFFYKEDVYVMVDGNKRITIYPDSSEQMIDLWFVDLTVYEEKKNSDN